MARAKQPYSISLKKEHIDRLEEAKKEEYGKGSRIVNQIFDDHLANYLAGKPSGAGISRDDIRQIIREELEKLQIQPGVTAAGAYEEQKQPVEVSKELENRVMSVLDSFFGMREE